MKKMSVLFLMLLMVAITTPASALILNYGVDVKSDGTWNLVSFYNGGSNQSDGKQLNTNNTSFTLTLDTPSVFGGYIVNSAYLFVDANGIGASPDTGVVSVQGISLGNLLTQTHANTKIPVVAGPPSAFTASSYTGDVDNTFFNLSPINLNDLTTDSTFTVGFNRSGGTFRINGINIQADVTSTTTPEPASFSLLGLGLLGLLKFRRKA